MEKIEKEIERIEKESVWEETDEVVTIKARGSLDKVIPIRLSTEAWAQLRQEANLLGVGPTTLARMWLLERLKTGEPKQVGTCNTTASDANSSFDYMIPAIAFIEYCKSKNIEKLDYSLFTQWVDLINKTRSGLTAR